MGLCNIGYILRSIKLLLSIIFIRFDVYSYMLNIIIGIYNFYI